MNKLTVFKSRTGWNVRYAPSHEDYPDVMRMFETGTIPLPFTVRASAETVILDLQHRMPDSDITLVVSGLSWTEVPGEVA